MKKLERYGSYSPLEWCGHRDLNPGYRLGRLRQRLSTNIYKLTGKIVKREEGDLCARQRGTSMVVHTHVLFNAS